MKKCLKTNDPLNGWPSLMITRCPVLWALLAVSLLVCIAYVDRPDRRLRSHCLR
jgi:hypothetical protein